MKLKTRHPTWSAIAAVLILQMPLLIACSQPADSPPTQPEPLPAVTSGYAEINQVKLYYEISGEGEPLLLLHGGLGGSEHFKKILPGLTGSFTVITVDRRGHGRSHDNGEPYSYAGMADEMSAFMDHLEIDSADIMGFSDGGVVGYHLAATHPQKVRKLVAVGANFRVDGLTEETAEWTRNRLNPEDLRKDIPEIEQKYMASNPQPENFPSFIERSVALWLGDPYLTKEQMTSIQAPVLFVLGDRDAIRIEHVLEMRDLVAKPQICVLPDASHFVLTENPEILLPILMGFLGN